MASELGSSGSRQGQECDGFRQADGWHVSIQTEYETEPPKHTGDSVGIDMGCVRFCTLSDGTFFEPCGALKKELKKLAWMQRRLARMQKFGKNWRKQKAAIARLHQHIANVRRDFIEKVSLEICKNHAEIFRDDLKGKILCSFCFCRSFS